MEQILTNPPAENPPAFTKLANLATQRLGSEVVACSDEFFAEASNLIKPGRSIFIVDKFTERGKWMDGWETRRHNKAGMDWAVIKLGLTGEIVGFDIDTNFFTGNNAPFASVEACLHNGAMTDFDSAEWVEILSKKPLGPGSQHFFTVDKPSDKIFNYVRLKMYPDGGIARLRVYGKVKPNWSSVLSSSAVTENGGLVDLIAMENAGLVVKCSDMFFSHPDNMLLPGRGVNMGDGWETKRSRVENHTDWAIIKLGAAAASIEKLVIDTAWFKGNFPEKAQIEVASDADAAANDTTPKEDLWNVILPPTEMFAHNIAEFEVSYAPKDPVTHVRLTIIPDGGVSRLRVFGRIAQ